MTKTVFVELPVVDEAYGPEVIQNRTVGVNEEFINFPIGKFAFSSGLIVHDGSWLKTPLTAEKIKQAIEKAEIKAQPIDRQDFGQYLGNQRSEIQDLQSRIDKACEKLTGLANELGRDDEEGAEYLELLDIYDGLKGLEDD